MGFDTYLNVGDRVALQWRKYASSLPRLLFRFDQLKIEHIEDGSYPFNRVLFEGTAEEALANLANAGIGWHATIGAYSQMRFSGQAAGMFMAHANSTRNTDWHAAEVEFDEIPPEVDLVNLGKLIAHQWGKEENEDAEASEDASVILLRDLTYDGSLPSSGNSVSQAFRDAREAGVDNPFAAARAAEVMAVLDRDAPLLVWPMVLSVFLQHLPSDTLVTLDISEAAAEHQEADPHAYAAQYWADSAESLSGTAQTLGRLFGVLSAFDNKLGRDFWFARAADILKRLNSLRDSGDESSTKERGDALEALFDSLMRTEEPELQVVEKNFRTTEEEIDILASNGLLDPFWVAHGSPLILVECKNWTDKPGVPELRVFESKIRDRGALCKIGIFVSTSGFTKTFLKRLKKFQSADGVIFAVDGVDLDQIVTSKLRLTDWLRTSGIRRSLGE
ncbi:restriction endonuclease [Streptomyces atroolivaceus]|uniref:restriction endonuclease n=1 Tax=Streptomyces griseus group TaxID=629295 RepID=UPI003430575D